MKFVEEYRDRETADAYARAIRTVTRRPWTIMEICGGQTHSIVKHGLEELLPEAITLVHGPGCPVCVTPVEMIDKAIALASRPDVIVTSYGDMLRVPGSQTDLLAVKAQHGNIRMVYSPLDALKIAREHPEKKVVFFAVGFETTAPAHAMAVWQARETGLTNFSILCSHVLVPPAMEAILSSPDNRVQAFLAAGHVCSVMGVQEYFPLASRFRVPIIATGFEPVDILQGILMAVRQLESGRYEVENQYARAVRPEGNPAARSLLAKVFETTDRKWRGIGMIPRSGYSLRDEFSAYDAEKIFDIQAIAPEESPLCMAGAVLQGTLKPSDCPAFAHGCTPEHPLGAPMVSSEGACAAYYHFRRQ